MHHLRYITILTTSMLLWLATTNNATAADLPKGTFTLQAADGGMWGIKVDGKGKFMVTLNGKEAVEGTYKITKDKIELMDVKGPHADIAAGVGIYQWNLKDDKLTFSKVKDKHEGRSLALTAGPWKRIKE